ncbi:conserved hypothetical protein [uncultured Desulfatiglans sp.]|uniref:ThiS family protein n=1 Tax=Uncultured Desulfatiglans sp. TaxID=1748965 RepID=A0A653A1P0_UNCDX|nr:conserved hypothetical protein [uncultured Desulfatiglans sp.]
MIKVKIKSFYAVGSTEKLQAALGGGDELVLDVAPGSTIADLLQSIPGIGDPEEFEDMMLHVFIDGRVHGFDHVIQPGEVLDIHIPVSGG